MNKPLPPDATTIISRLESKILELNGQFEGRMDSIDQDQQQIQSKYVSDYQDVLKDADTFLSDGDQETVKGIATSLNEAIDTRDRSLDHLNDQRIEAAKEHYTSLDRALVEGFDTVIDWQGSLPSHYDPAGFVGGISPDQVTKARELVSSRESDYRKAHARIQRGVGDDIDVATIEKYNQSQDILKQYAEEKNLWDLGFVIPVRIEHDEDGQVLDVSLALHERYETLGDLLRDTLDRSQSKEEVKTTLVQALEQFDNPNLCATFFEIEQPNVSAQNYTLKDLAEHFEMPRNQLSGIIYRRIGKENLDDYSILEKDEKGKKFRVYDRSILGILDQEVRAFHERQRNPTNLFGGRPNRGSSPRVRAEPDEEPEQEADEPAVTVEVSSEQAPESPARNGTPEGYETLKETMRLLQYRSHAALRNPHLIRETIDGRDYITRASIDEFLRTHERTSTGRYLPRRNSVEGEGISSVVEQPMTLSKKDHRLMRYYRDGLTAREIADKMKCTPETVRRNLHTLGVFNKSYVQEKFNTLDIIKEQEIPGARTYPKDEQRITMLEHLSEKLSVPQIQYLGLEGPHFCSYIDMSRFAGERLSPDDALIVEYNPVHFNIMQSFVNHHDQIEGGEIFDGLDIRYGDLKDVVSELDGHKFNFLNLDYEGHLSPSAVETLENLFTRELLDDQALLFITLNNQARMRSRVPGEVKDEYHQLDAFVGHLARLAPEHDYGARQIKRETYTSRESPMIIGGYLLEK